MVTRRSDQPRSSNAINAAVEVIGDSCWLPVLRDVMFGNTSSTCRNDPKRESPRTSSPTASGGWSPAVSSPGARHPWSPREYSLTEAVIQLVTVMAAGRPRGRLRCLLAVAPRRAGR
jgi:hypothetical protein